MSKYIVTGGAGFIGSHVVDQLIARGDEVHVVDIFLGGRRDRLNPKATLYEVDIRDFDKLAPIFQGAVGVFHLAAQPRMQYSIQEPRLTNDINITGTLNVLLASRDAGVKRVVYSASSSAYGTSHPMPLREDMEAHPVIPYAIQKRVGEQYCEMVSRFYGLETVAIRYFNVYGPRQTTDKDGPYATVIGIFLGQAGAGKPMTVVPDGTQRRDFTHVYDTARANLCAMEFSKVGKGEIINIGTGTNYSVIQVAEMIGGQWEFAEPRQGETKETLADNTKAKELLGWEPKVSFEEGIEELKKLHGLA
ncbi:MAG: NAD-dependent epimerase/dehydratase family protein [Candidatus Sungbacteria bacterium]|nr:NAD-dependent epimerase/dehydratase family protein [bacterium]MDZ4260670.1 NAD-dependent epimerase/dehydratase family protein [Candidatus Sungbacteria bacterium]